MERERVNEDKQALQDFLMDINDLNRIEEKTSKFNAFETLGIVNTEIRHSNILGWLMSPNEQHGIGETFISKIIQEVTRNYDVELKGHDPLKLLLRDYHDLVVRREWRNIDLLAISETNKLMLVIENKVWSKESAHQLKKYQDIVENEYPEYQKLFIYLTPFGDDASNPDVWMSMNYRQIVEMIESALILKQNMMETSVKHFIEQYIDTLRRYVVGDNEIEKICQEIYFKHKRALDLIFEYKPDVQSDIAGTLREMIEADDELILDDSNKGLIRFTTKSLDQKIPNEGSGWTSSGRILLFEFQNTTKGLRIKLIIGPGDENVRNKLYEVVSFNPDYFRGRNKKLTSAYTAMYLKNILNYNDIYELDQEKLHEDIKIKVDQFLNSDLKELEWVLLNEYGVRV
ncbi:PD-(D/E)XK nuclease family protein [Salinicoccus sp. ID82-1]|uniref:PDDEXK-like family protein n=1 Tax=Salinicoccus sp. ID82-1 TaxID=2820269 RepID=UPI001F16A995|nr:PD-(D/E)XK nuclease family protein [Salinicoccus sp. ID82-1]MCG1009710.1 PD-(D/E)XK nuclease family protein [Salinicoccus sp. ID82-1]